MSVLESGSELSIELNKDRTSAIVDIVAMVLDVDVEHETKVLSALTEPIDDPDAKDPKSFHEAQKSIYWAE